MDRAYHNRMRAFYPRFEEAHQLLETGEQRQALALLRALAEQGFSPLCSIWPGTPPTTPSRLPGWRNSNGAQTGQIRSPSISCAWRTISAHAVDLALRSSMPESASILKEAVSLGYERAQDWLDELIREEARQQRGPFSLRTRMLR